MELMEDADWILTKNTVMEKMAGWMHELFPLYRQILLNREMADWQVVESAHYKISKGENYRGLPWLMLDFPRLFGQTDILAIRTLFWWGRYFSLTLQVSGKWKKQVQENLRHSRSELAAGEFWIAAGDDPWIHEIRTPDYLPIAGMVSGEYSREILNKNWVKIAKKYSLDRWEDLPGMAGGDYEKLIGLAGL